MTYTGITQVILSYPGIYQKIEGYPGITRSGVYPWITSNKTGQPDITLPNSACRFSPLEKRQAGYPRVSPGCYGLSRDKHQVGLSRDNSG